MSDDGGGTRFVVDVPSPKVSLVLGKGTPSFGYLGVSLKAADSLYFSIAKDSLVENGGSYAHVAKAYWSVFTKKELSLSANSQLNLASKRITMVAAGGGYGEDTQTGVGHEPPIATFNSSDVQDILHPLAAAVSAFETAFLPAVTAFNGVLGYGPPPNPAANAAAVAGRLAWLAKLLAGSPPPGTPNSLFVEEFLPEEHGLIGILSKIGGAMDKLNRALQRPDNLPIAGPLFQKANQIRDGITALTEASEGVRSLIEKQTWTGFADDSNNETKAFGKDRDKVTGEGEWEEKAKATGSLFTSDVVHMVRPLRNLARNIRSTVLAVQELAESVGQILGILPPPPSALGLVAKHGVSVLTPDRFFAYAKDGFHFLSAAPPAAAASWYEALDKKIRGFLTMSPPRPKATPGFFVNVSGHVEVASEQNVRLRALGTVASLMSDGSVDVAANGGALLRSLNVAEVIAPQIAIGVPTLAAAQQASVSALANALLPALQATRSTAQQEATQASANVDAKRLELDTFRAARVSAAVTVTGKIAAYEALALRETAEYEPLVALRTLKREAFRAADQAVTLALAASPPAVGGGSSVGQTLGLRDAGLPLTDKVLVAAIDETTLYGGKKITAESVAIGLTAKAVVPVPGESSVKLESTKVEIKVGNATVTVAESAGQASVTIAITGGGTVTVSALGVTLDGGGKPIKLTNAAQIAANATGALKLSADGTISIG